MQKRTLDILMNLWHSAVFRFAWPHYVFPPECNPFSYPFGMGGGETYTSLFCFSFPFPVHFTPPCNPLPLRKRKIWYKIFYPSIMLCYTKVFFCERQKQKKTRMHSSRMRTARSSSRAGGLHQAPPQDQPPRACTLPGSRPPLEQAPPGTGTPQDQTPGSRYPPRSRHTPWEQAHPWSRHPSVGRHPPGAGTPPEQAPPRDQTIPSPRRRHPPPVDRHTPVNILPCPKLRVRAVKRLGEFGQGHGHARFIVWAEEIRYCFWYNWWFDQLKLYMYSFYVS